MMGQPGAAFITSGASTVAFVTFTVPPIEVVGVIAILKMVEPSCISKTPLQVKSVPAPLYKPRLLPFASVKVPPLSTVNWSTVKDPGGSVTL